MLKASLQKNTSDTIQPIDGENNGVYTFTLGYWFEREDISATRV